MRKEIMVIDDSPAIRYMLQTILKKHYKVISVPDGVSAMYYLRQSAHPDLIIMDPELPDLADWELVRHLSGSHLYSSIPLMVISNESEEDTRSKSVLFGVMDFFLKPFNPISLLESVDNILVGNAMGKVY
jgi:two-component system chemotaxis response regulator CheY